MRRRPPATLTPKERSLRELEALITSRLARASSRILSAKLALHHFGPGSARFEVELVAAMSELDQAEQLHLQTPGDLIRLDPIMQLVQHAETYTLRTNNG